MEKTQNDRYLFFGLCYVYIVIAVVWRMYYSSLLDSPRYVGSALRILDGSLRIYHGARVDGHLPLFAITISPLVYLAHHVPFVNDKHLIGLVPILFDVLCIYQFHRVLAGSALGDVKGTRLLICSALLLNPVVFYGSAEMGHPESMMAYFILLGIWYKDYPVKSGIAFGLAQLSEHVALFGIIPMFLYLVATRDHRHWIKFAAASIGTFSLVFLPFFLADPSETLHMVLLNQMAIHLIGTNLWTILLTLFGNHDSIRHFGVAYSSILMLGLAIVIPSLTFFAAKKRDLYGTILICLSLQLIFAISLAPYHAVRVLFLLFCWDTLRRKSSLPYIALLFSFGIALLQSLQAYSFVQALKLILCVSMVFYVFFNLDRLPQEDRKDYAGAYNS